MANTVLSRVDQPKVPAVSGIGTFVAVLSAAPEKAVEDATDHYSRAGQRFQPLQAI